MTTEPRVYVPAFKRHGTVIAERHGGHELSVRLDPPLLINIWLRRDQVAQAVSPPVISIDSKAPAELPAPLPLPAPKVVSPALRAAQQRLDRLDPAEKARWRKRVGRNIAEALRFGLVPKFAVEALSVGLDVERKLFASDLERTKAEGAVRILVAPYGAGKSHALDVIQFLAKKENFVVARTELDAFECQPNQPRAIYRKLMRSLAVPGANRHDRGLEVLLDHAVASDKVMDCFTRKRPGAWHEFLGPALLNWAKLEAGSEGRALLYQWISGEEVNLEALRSQAAVATARTQLLALSGFTTLSSHFTYLLGGLSTLITLLGHSGLVVLLDEAEHLRLLSVEMTSRAIDFFKGLVANALGASLPAAYLENCYQGGLKKLPFYWRRPAHVYLVTACTPTPGRNDLLAWAPDRACVTAPPSHLSTGEMAMLVEKIVMSYSWAFPGLPAIDDEERRRLAAGLQAALSSGALGNLRQVVQTMVGGLDLIRGGKDWSWRKVVSEVEGFSSGRRP